eukprot:scaffold251748_cov32-Tisochrysis_lutea.AAC.2
MAVKLGNGTRGVLAVVKVDEGKSARLVRLSVLGKVNTLDSAEPTEELTQVGILDLFRQVRDTYGARVVPLRHLRVAGPIGIPQTRWDVRAPPPCCQCGEATAASTARVRPIARVAWQDAL